MSNFANLYRAYDSVPSERIYVQLTNSEVVIIEDITDDIIQSQDPERIKEVLEFIDRGIANKGCFLVNSFYKKVEGKRISFKPLNVEESLPLLLGALNDNIKPMR